MPTRTPTIASVDELTFGYSTYELVRDHGPNARVRRIDLKPVNAVIQLADELGTEIRVRRDAKLSWFLVQPTDEEIAERRVEGLWYYLESSVVKRGEQAYATAVERMTSAMTEGAHAISSFTVDELIVAKARQAVGVRVKNIMKRDYAGDGPSTQAERVERVKEIALNEVVRYYGANSSSQISNIMDNTEHLVWVDMLREMKAGTY